MMPVSRAEKRRLAVLGVVLIVCSMILFALSLGAWLG